MTKVMTTEFQGPFQNIFPLAYTKLQNPHVSFK